MKRSSLYSILFAGIVFAAGLTGFSQNIASTGISGGRGGFQFSDSDIPQGARVLEIRVFAGDWVDAVQIIYTLPNGRIVESARHGGSGGRQNIFRLDSDEYVTGVSGRYGPDVPETFWMRSG
ncbi:MAG: hypothetical protein P8Z37_17300 [Acidobacteriota bacterium]